MSNLARDKRILELVTRTYDFQCDLRERLDSKLNNFIGITGTVSTLSVGVGLFVFDKIKQDNPLYPYLAVTFLLFFAFFISAMVVGLTGYKPTELVIYPDDPEKIIQDYSKFPSETHVIRVVAASIAEATNKNKIQNKSKSKLCQWVFCLLVIGAFMFVIFAIIMIASLGYVPPTANTGS